MLMTITMDPTQPSHIAAAGPAWSLVQWSERDRALRQRALNAPDDDAAWRLLSRSGRGVLRTYSTSFFIVTRWLPPSKRAQVESIYAAVRYPDEIVDSFAMPGAERVRLLEEWSQGYENGLNMGVREALREGVPCYAAAFCEVARRARIPHEYYRAFLEAMRLDVEPVCYETLDDLIERYVYGSAIVVGYFLAHVYGPAAPGEFDRAMKASRDLGIALQLTNFLRDVAEDQRRGRCYMPKDLLRAEGIEQIDVHNPAQREALARVLAQVAAVARRYYNEAAANLDAFAPDSRMAIHACGAVYGQLNERLESVDQEPERVGIRESVPMRDKFRVLPADKYWRLPLAYMTR
jgi:phytoene synthase